MEGTVCSKGPIRVLKRTPADGYEVGPSQCDDVVCQLGIENQSDGHGQDFSLLPNLFRKWDLESVST